jgi:DNA repair exonuclease SbcCD ATPase subunit
MLDRTDELPALTAEAFRRIDRAGSSPRSAPADALDHTLESLLEAVEQAEIGWRRLEARLDVQDRAISELQDEMHRAGSAWSGTADRRGSGVPELTEIVPIPAVADPPDAESAATADAGRASLLARIAALEAYIAGQNERLRALESELEARARRITELEAHQDIGQ